MGSRKRKLDAADLKVDMSRFQEDATQHSNSSFWHSPEDPYFFPSEPEDDAEQQPEVKVEKKSKKEKSEAVPTQAGGKRKPEPTRTSPRLKSGKAGSNILREAQQRTQSDSQADKPKVHDAANESIPTNSRKQDRTPADSGKQVHVSQQPLPKSSAPETDGSQASLESIDQKGGSSHPSLPGPDSKSRATNAGVLRPKGKVLRQSRLGFSRKAFTGHLPAGPTDINGSQQTAENPLSIKAAEPDAKLLTCSPAMSTVALSFIHRFNHHAQLLSC